MPEAFRVAWTAQSGWAVAAAGRYGRGCDTPGVRLEPFGRRGLATIIAKPGQEDALDLAMQAWFGFGLPASGRAFFGPTGDLVWLAPNQWLAVLTPSSVDDWQERHADLAAVTDQSDGRALVRVSGSHARTVLAKGVSIDLHPAVFTVGSAAATGVAHMAVHLWRQDGADVFVVAVPRSFADSFWSWLMTASASYGVEVMAEDV